VHSHMAGQMASSVWPPPMKPSTMSDRNKESAMKNAATRGSAKKKCSIEWMSKGVPTRVAFPVSSCLMKCNVANSDYRYTHVFAKFFEMEQDGRYCKCKQKGQEGRISFNLAGKCPNDNGEECFDRYTTIRTETYSTMAGSTAVTRTQHLPDKNERTFQYDCDDAEWTDADTTEPYMPTILEGRDQDEQDAFKTVLKKFAEKGYAGLNRDERDMFDVLSQDEKDAIIEEMRLREEEENADMEEKLLYQDLSGKDGLTVGKLRGAYDKMLEDTGVSVPHLLAMAELADKPDETPVDQDTFIRFLRPDCANFQ